MTDEILLRRKIKEKGLKINFIANELGLSTYGLMLKIQNKWSEWIMWNSRNWFIGRKRNYFLKK